MNDQMTFSKSFEYSVGIENLTLNILVDAVIYNTSEDISDLTMHIHSYSEFFVCKYGEITLNTENGELTLYGGDCALIPVNYRHNKIPSKKKADWCSVGINCVKRNLKSSKYSKNCRNLFDFYNGLCTADTAIVVRNRADICEMVMNLLPLNDSSIDFYPALRMADILVLLTNNGINGKSDEYNAKDLNETLRMSQLDQLINVGFMNDLTTADMADKLFISERQLARITKKRYGTTLHRVINNKRIETAERMLRCEDKSAEEIGTAVGFNSKSCFYREFNLKYGMTPSEYRKKNKSLTQNQINKQTRKQKMVNTTGVWLSDENYSNYRIPGIVVTKSGKVIIYCEARKTSDDWSMMDILLKTSEDGGKTFGETVKIACGDEKYPTVNNPVCIVGNDGILHMLYCRDYSIDGGNVFYIRSNDEGKTWSKPRDIMEYTSPEYHNVFACGPGHGLCTRSGMLLTPIWMVPKSAGYPIREHHPGEVSTLYSIDNGESWKLGEIICGNSEVIDPNETSAAELDDGSIVLNIRCSGCGYRAVSRSKNGYESWTEPKLDYSLPDPTCFGSVASYSFNDTSALLFVNCEHQTERQNIVLKASFDGGWTWPLSETIDGGEGGYCDIATAPDGTIYILYEQYYKNLYLAKTDFMSLTQSNK